MMIIDVIRTNTVTVRIVSIGTGLVFAALLSLGHLSAANLDDEVKVVLAIEADPDYGEYLAGACLTCHSPSGSDKNIPRIHGQDAASIAAALIEYKNKTRENETMRSVAGALANDEMAALAAYFSQSR